MLRVRDFLWTFAALALAGCGSNVVVGPGGPGVDAGPDAPPVDSPLPIDVSPPPDAPRVCVTTADCRPGEECLVHEGCDTPSFCGPQLGRPCTDDLAPFCGCDGVTFRGSSTCPQRSYRHRGECGGVDAGPGACRLPDGTTCPLGSTCALRDGCNRCACSRDGVVSCTGVACIDAGPPACMFPDGRLCAVGSRCPAPDGCNTCTCGRDGTLSCTEIACPDAGPLSCVLPDGRRCPVGSTCRTGECTTCFCTAEGRLLCTGGCVDAGPPVDVPLPRSCRSSGDCPPSMICDGPQGCETRWTCVPARPCTADLAPFCGCDGRTFNSSSSCVGQPYQHRGACAALDAGAADAGPGARCAPQDARGEGLCDGFFGYSWNGRTCAGISGCRCVGSDCGRLPFNPRECYVAHEGCPTAP